MGEAFWRFSLVLYGRPGVAQALLRLQHRDGCDVNLMLFALWCGAVLRRRLEAPELAAAEAASAPLRDAVVTPLRELRQKLKPAAEPAAQDLRRRVMALELAAERRVQYRLAASIGGTVDEAADPIAPAEANLALYLGPARSVSAEAAALRAALAAMVLR
jgi:uncharacterized protein (TIGR02444 family)